jgi:prophage regulatory protein
MTANHGHVLATVGPLGERFLRIQEVMKKVGMGRATIYARVNSGQFPRPIKLSPRMARWRESEIEQWMSQRGTGPRAINGQEAAR